MKKWIVALVAGCQLIVSQYAHAQAPQSWTSAEMYQALRKLNVLGSVLYIAAHPDDENTRLITYLSKDRLYRTGYLSLTRGDGGQNLIGNEQGIELGLIRTQELLAARRMDGGEQFFSRAYDFGFSKNPEETFTKWDREKILSDVVWVIRKFQPDVIITRFPTTGEGGHGHHTASAILANEAYNAAADPKRFPEQLKYVSVWQTKRVLFNNFNFSGTNIPAPNQLKLDVGGYNPLLGKSYGEIAAESRSNHKSQGFGATASRGESYETFATTSGSNPANDIMDDVDQTWNRVAGGQKIAMQIDALIRSFDLLRPENSVKGLVELYQAINTLPDGYWKSQKLKEVTELIEQCSGLFLEVTTASQFAVQTDSVRLNFSFNNRLGTDAALTRVKVDALDSSFNVRLDRNRNFNFFKNLYVPITKPLTQPYWLERKMEEGYFNVKDQLQIGQADVDPAYLVSIQVKMYGQELTFNRAVKFKFTDPVKGELYEPLVVVPRAVLHPGRDVLVFTDNNERPMEVTVKAFKNISLDNSPAFAANTANRLQVGEGSFERGQERRFTKMIKPVADNPEFTLFVGNPADSLFRDKHEIKYEHIPYINYYTRAAFKLRSIDLKTYNKKIGYIIGAGDKVPDALEQMGYEVTLLTEKDMARINLKQFDAIITGVRAYNTNEWMNNQYEKLMSYVNDGGNLIVQYNTSSNIGPVRAKIAPYNFNISRTRVTDENAKVTFLQPDHQVLNFPNKITEQDFAGWVQERSIYHGADWDSHFETILSMNDPGEKPDAGSLLIAKYGKGYFTYTGLVFFRELPAGVPGAYRLLANIIALNKKKAF